MRKRVAFLFHDVNICSGATKSLLDIISNLNQKEMSIYAVLPRTNGELETILNDLNITVIKSSYHGNTYVISRMRRHPIVTGIKVFFVRIYNAVSSAILASILRREKIDVVYSNTGTIYAGVAVKMINRRIKHIWHIREFVEEDQGCGIVGGRKHFYRLLNRYTDDIIFISKALAKKYEDNIWRPNEHIIYNDISVSYIQSGFSDYNSFGMMNILMCGNICPGKGQKQVIKALGKLRDNNIPCKLYLAGKSTDVDYFSELKKLIANLGLTDRVIFLGTVSDVNKVRRDTKFTVVASRMEAFGRTTVESMLSGHYVVAANCGASPEIITDGKDGRLYEYGNWKELAGILMEAYNNSSKVNKICRAAYVKALKYTEHNCANSIRMLILQ